MPNKLCGEITYQFPNFNGCIIEVWGWIRNFTSHFMIDVITYLGLKLIRVSKRSPWCHLHFRTITDMDVMASQINHRQLDCYFNSLLNLWSGRHENSSLLCLCGGILVTIVSLYKGPVMRKAFPSYYAFMIHVSVNIVDLWSVRSSEIHLRTISQEKLQRSITEINLDITFPKLSHKSPGAQMS